MTRDKSLSNLLMVVGRQCLAYIHLIVCHTLNRRKICRFGVQHLNFVVDDRYNMIFHIYYPRRMKVVWQHHLYYLHCQRFLTILHWCNWLSSIQAPSALRNRSTLRAAFSTFYSDVYFKAVLKLFYQCPYNSVIVGWRRIPKTNTLTLSPTTFCK